MSLLFSAVVPKHLKSVVIFITQILTYFDFTPHFSISTLIFPLPNPPLDGDRSNFQTVAGMIAWDKYVQILYQLPDQEFPNNAGIHTTNQYSETNVMYFLFSLLRIKGLYMFLALVAHHQEVLHKQHLLYCTQCTKCCLCRNSWGWASNAPNM
jgi:hypothetical protein